MSRRTYGLGFRADHDSLGTSHDERGLVVKRFLCTGLVLALAGKVWGAEPVTFNPQAFSTNDPIDSVAAETAFLNAAVSGGFATFSEDFESPLWDATRSPASADIVVSHGIAWHSSIGNRLRTVADSDSDELPPPYMIYLEALRVDFASTPAHSNFVLQANRSPFDPFGWTGVTNPPTVLGGGLYRFTLPLPPEPAQIFRIISTP